MTSAQATQRHRVDRTVVALLTSVFCSATAVLTGVTALGLHVFDLTGRELDLGLLGLAEFAPALLLVLVTGSVADRFDRRRLTSLACATAALCGVGLALYAASDPTAVGPIFLLVVAFGVARAFLAPASRSLPADAVPPERLHWLVARASAASQCGFIVGPLLGGFLYDASPVASYVAMAALYLVSAVAVSFIQLVHRVGAHTPASDRRVSPRERLADALQGWRFIRHQPVLLGAISLDLFAVLAGGAVALLPALADERLDVGSVGLGWLRAAVGIGAVGVSLALVRRPISRRVGPVLIVVVAIYGLGPVALGVTTDVVVAFVAIAVLSGADAVSVYIRSTLVPLVTPPAVRGRVLALEMVFIGASNELGSFEAGVVGEVLGAPTAVAVGGAITVVIAAGWWVLFPSLRRLDRFPRPTV